MPERSFGRTVRYRRTKLGLTQAKLAELVGRSTATIRSWERDGSRPNDPQTLSALSAILGVDERHLFEKAEVEQVVTEETSPTVEQALASLAPASRYRDDTDRDERPTAVDEVRQREYRPVSVTATPTPAFTAPPDPFVQTPLTPSLADISYVEDPSQRQQYRIRNLATAIAVVALLLAFVWALGEGLGALGDWWDAFFAQLRL